MNENAIKGDAATKDEATPEKNEGLTDDMLEGASGGKQPGIGAQEAPYEGKRNVYVRP